MSDRSVQLPALRGAPSDGDVPPRPGPVGPRAREARVVLEPSAGTAVTVRAELARTPAEHARGLMYRRSLDEDAGMLFVFAEPDHHLFWMANTPLSLDMIFIGSNEQVVGLVEHAEPMSARSYGIGEPSLYVLEVVGGFAARHGIRPGTRVRIESSDSVEREG